MSKSKGKNNMNKYVIMAVLIFIGIAIFNLIAVSEDSLLEQSHRLFSVQIEREQRYP